MQKKSNSMNSLFTLGCDPELFIINKKTNKVVSAIGLIPGEKGNPYRPEESPNGYGMEIDNILAEFNIPPAHSKLEWTTYIQYMLNKIEEYVQNINPDYGIKTVASQHVDEDQLNNPIAKLFGCSVDYNAYTGKPNPKPKGESTNLRSAGFHVHFGYEYPNIKTSLELVKLFDIILGVPSVLLDNDKERRSLYGKAGCFRLTDYGVEYRVLSSYFLSDYQLFGFIYDQINHALYNLREISDIRSLCMYMYDKTGTNENIIRSTINDGNVEKATEIIKKLNIKLPCVEFLA